MSNTEKSLQISNSLLPGYVDPILLAFYISDTVTIVTALISVNYPIVLLLHRFICS